MDDDKKNSKIRVEIHLSILLESLTSLGSSEWLFPNTFGSSEPQSGVSFEKILQKSTKFCKDKSILLYYPSSVLPFSVEDIANDLCQVFIIPN